MASRRRIPSLLPTSGSELRELPASGENLALIPGKQEEQLVALSGQQTLGLFGCCSSPFFTALSAKMALFRGCCKLANIPFVGAGVLGSAVGMDKDVMKRLLRDAEIPIARFIALNRYSAKDIDFDDARNQLGLPLFIKPANLGSSVGIHKVRRPRGIRSAQFAMRSITTIKY